MSAPEVISASDQDMSGSDRQLSPWHAMIQQCIIVLLHLTFPRGCEKRLFQGIAESLFVPH